MVDERAADERQQQQGLTLRCKVAVCGEASVGKTALAQMFVSKSTFFPKNYKMVRERARRRRR